MRVTMKAIKKFVKTYDSKDGKRTYRQIRFNNGDDLEDGVVFVLTKSQYEEVSICQNELKKTQQQLTNLKEENNQLNKDFELCILDADRKLKDLTRKHEGQLKSYDNQIHQLEKKVTRYQTLAEERQDQLDKMEKANTDLIKWKEANIGETARLSAKLEDCQEQSLKRNQYK